MRTHRSIWIGLTAVVSLGLAAALAGCGGEPIAGADDGRYRVVTTTGMVRDIVQNVAGDHARVEGLIGAGRDPHLYDPTRSDVLALRDADVVFYSGLNLEGRMTDLFDSLARQGKPVYAVTTSIDRDRLIFPPGYETFGDPHVWMDASMWSRAVEVVAERLVEYDPDHAETYRANAEAYLARLEELDEYVRRVTATIPEAQRVLVTAHDAFGYFGRAYDVEVRGIQGISTESEAGLDDINQIVDFIVERRIPAIFVESSVSEANVRTLIEGAGAQGHEVRIGGTLFSDATGPAGTYEGTYIGMIDHNATTIVHALGGEAPQRGMQGKLGRPEAVAAHE